MKIFKLRAENYREWIRTRLILNLGIDGYVGQRPNPTASTTSGFREAESISVSVKRRSGAGPLQTPILDTGCRSAPILSLGQQKRLPGTMFIHKD